MPCDLAGALFGLFGDAFCGFGCVMLLRTVAGRGGTMGFGLAVIGVCVCVGGITGLVTATGDDLVGDGDLDFTSGHSLPCLIGGDGGVFGLPFFKWSGFGGRSGFFGEDGDFDAGFTVTGFAAVFNGSTVFAAGFSETTGVD